MANSISLPKFPERGRSLSLVAGYLLAYVALDWVSYIYPIGPLGITPWNPPPGLSLALLLRYGLRNGPWLMVAAFAAEVLVRGAPAPLLWLALSSAVLAAGYTLLAWLLEGPLRFQRDFVSMRDAVMFTSVVTAATAALAVAYVAIFHAAGLLPAHLVVKSIAQFWIGDLIGIVVTTPLLLVLTRDDPPWTAVKPWEALAQMLSIAVTLWVVFASGLAVELNLFYLLFIPLIWIALRNGLPGTTVATLLIQLGLIAALKLGGFAAAIVLQFQFLLLALAITGLFFGAALSERRQSELRLHEKQVELDRSLRLAAASELASALAHELNQPLSAIATYVSAARFMASDDATSRQALGETMDKIVRETARASSVVQRLREFFRAGSMRLEPLDVEPLVRTSVLAERQRLERHRISCDVSCVPELPPVMGDRVQIGIVLHNLLANAIDAVKENAADARSIRVTAEPGGTRLVRVRVADSGAGITKELAEALLHPFSTTKPTGMGLGLAISRSIVEAHGGRLSIEAGEGGIVSFTLPTAPVR